MRRTSVPPQLPGYTFLKVLGSGGFSDVFLYEQALPKRRVAVKVLLVEELSGANRTAFVAEANLMAQLSTHPYIVTIYQADVAGDDRPYFVMEYCSGPSLAERYKQETFPVADALRTGVRLSSAVATAHSAGILHRDIKPANVLTNDYGWPALTDFGISSTVEDDAAPLHTGTLATALAAETSGSGADGTAVSVGMSVPWSPPEMFEDDPDPDVRSDVFSLSATIYTILAGHTPFEVPGRSNGTLDLIGRIERGAITPMVRTDLPRSLLAVLQKGMASHRADRFATAVDFARALQRVELELGYAPTTIDVPNLRIDAPSRVSSVDDADETRVRSVTSIDAQQSAAGTILPRVVVPPTAAQSPAVVGALASDRPAADVPLETVVRRRVTTAIEPRGSEKPALSAAAPSATSAKSTSPVEEADAPSGVRLATLSRSRKILIGVTAAVVALIAVVVVFGVVTGGAPQSRSTTKPASVGGGSAIVETTPMPTLVSPPTLNGRTIVFTFANPAPKAGDSFQWKISNRASTEPVHGSADGVVSVPDYTAGSTICVQMTVVRSGQTSSPTEACFPS